MKFNPKIFFITLASFIFLIFIVFAAGYIYANNIAKKVGKNVPYFVKTFHNAYKHNQFKDSKFINILVLGLDKRDDQLEKTTTTDTIILASINTQTGQINLISFPRDIWSYDLKMKINGIYPLSLEENKSFDFIETEYEKIFGQNIDKTVIITTDNLIDLIKTVGGVDINLEKGFTDNQYPNPEYVANPSPKIPIYKTVTFADGINHIDETNVTEFVRSRKGAETAAEGGTDIGRIQRQQLLIEAIMAKVKSSEFLKNYQNIIGLYNFWQNEISTNLTDLDLISITLKIKDHISQIKLNKINIPIGNKSTEGIIFHPETTTFTKQWIYIPSGESNYNKLHEFINASLN